MGNSDLAFVFRYTKGDLLCVRSSCSLEDKTNTIMLSTIKEVE